MQNHFGIKLVIVEHSTALGVGIAVGLVIQFSGFGGPMIEFQGFGTMPVAVAMVIRWKRKKFARSGSRSGDNASGNQSLLLVKFPRENNSAGGGHTCKDRSTNPENGSAKALGAGGHSCRTWGTSHGALGKHRLPKKNQTCKQKGNG